MISLNKHSISASIAERYAYINYEFTFENLNENGSNELSFEITIHPNSFISGFTADIDGELFKGKTKEKKEAKQEYQAAKEKNENAILISQPHDNIPNVFQIKSNIDAKSKILLNIKIEQYLSKQFNFNQLHIELLKEFSYRITKKYDWISFQFDVSDRNGINEIHIPSNEENMIIKDKVIEKINENKVKITGKIMDKSSINELILKYKIKDEKTGSNVLFDKNTKTFCHIISDLIGNTSEEKTEEINANVLIPRRVVIIIDRSGSMSGIKWDKTISATITALKQLRCGYDRYCVILCGNELVLHPKQQITRTDNDNVEKCIKILETQRAEGCELINDALLKGIQLIKDDIKLLNVSKDIKYNYYQNQVILLTDGEPTIGETNTDKIVENVKNANNLKGIDKYSSKVSVHSFGIGSDRNDGSWARDLNHNFLKLLSVNNYGIYQRIKQTRTDRLLNEYFDILSKPVLTNIQIKYTDTNCTDLTKTSFNTLFAGNDIIICGKLHNIKTLTLTANVTAITGQQIKQHNGKLIVKPIEINKTIKVKLNAYEINDDEKSDEKIINRIWAYLKLKQFSEKRLMDDDMIEFDEDDDKIPLALAMKYHFVSPWTSMIVVKHKQNQKQKVKLPKIEQPEYLPGFGSSASQPPPFKVKENKLKPRYGYKDDAYSDDGGHTSEQISDIGGDSTGADSAEQVLEMKDTLLLDVGYDAVSEATHVYSWLHGQKIDSKNKAAVKQLKQRLASLLTSRSEGYRQTLIGAYRQQYNLNLEKDIKKIIVKGHAMEIIHGLLMTRAQYDAILISEYVANWDIDPVADIICCRSIFQLQELHDAYKKKCKLDVKKQLQALAQKDKNKTLVKIIGSILDLNRKEDINVDMNKVNSDLNFVLTTKKFKDQNKVRLVMIFAQNSVQYIKVLNDQFLLKSRDSLTTFIDKKLGPNGTSGYYCKTRIMYALDTPDYYAQKIKTLGKNYKKNKKKIQDIFIQRMEIDLELIKRVWYNKKYGDGKNLKMWITNKTAGSKSGYFLSKMLDNCSRYNECHRKNDNKPKSKAEQMMMDHYT